MRNALILLLIFAFCIFVLSNLIKKPISRSGSGDQDQPFFNNPPFSKDPPFSNDENGNEGITVVNGTPRPKIGAIVFKSFEESDVWIRTLPVIEIGIHICVNASIYNEFFDSVNVMKNYFIGKVSEMRDYYYRDLRVNLTLYSIKYYTTDNDQPWKFDDPYNTSRAFITHILNHCSHKYAKGESLFPNADDSSYEDYNVVSTWSEYVPMNEVNALNSYFMENYISLSGESDLNSRVNEYVNKVSRIWLLHYSNSGSLGPFLNDNIIRGMYQGPSVFHAGIDLSTASHELGHTLGLFHPQDVELGDGQLSKGSYEKVRGVTYDLKMCSFLSPHGGVWGMSDGVNPKQGVTETELQSSIKTCDSFDMMKNDNVNFVQYESHNDEYSFSEGFQCDHLSPWKWKGDYITSESQIDDMNSTINDLSEIKNLPCWKHDQGMSEYGGQRFLYGSLYPNISHNSYIEWLNVQCNEHAYDRNIHDFANHYNYNDNSQILTNVDCSNFNLTGPYQRTMHSRTGGSFMGYYIYEHKGLVPEEIFYARKMIEYLISISPESRREEIVKPADESTNIPREVEYFYDTTNSALVLVLDSDRRSGTVYANMHAHTMINMRCELMKCSFEILFNEQVDMDIETCINFFNPSHVEIEKQDTKYIINIKRPYKLNYIVVSHNQYSPKGHWSCFKRNYSTYPKFSSTNLAPSSEEIFDTSLRKLPLMKLHFNKQIDEIGIFIRYMTAVGLNEMVGADEPLIVNRNGIIRNNDYDENSIKSELSIISTYPNPSIIIRTPPFPGHISLPPYSTNFYEMYKNKKETFNNANPMMTDETLIGHDNEIIFQQDYKDIQWMSPVVKFKNTNFEFEKDYIWGTGAHEYENFTPNLQNGFGSDRPNPLLSNVTQDDKTIVYASQNFHTQGNRSNCIHNGTMEDSCYNMEKPESSETVIEPAYSY